jgi:MFS family permease
MSSLSVIRETFSNRNIAVIMITEALSTFISWLWWPYQSLFILELGATKELLGMLLMVGTFSQLLFQYPGGVFADRFGRQKVIVLSSVLSVIPPLIYLTSTNWTHLGPALVIAATGVMSRPARNALIAESLPNDKRSSGFAAISMVTRIPRLFTSLLGGILMDYYGVYEGVRMVMVASVVVAFFSTLLRWRYISETLNLSTVKEKRSKPALTGIRALKEAGSMPRNVWIMTVVAGLSAFAARVTFSFTVIYAVEIIGLSKTEYGLIGTVVSIITMLLTLPGGILADRIGKKMSIILSRSLASLSTLGITYAGGFWQMGAVRILGGVASGLGGTYMRVRGGPVWTALVADITPVASRGRMMGLMGTIVSLVSSPGSWAGGYLYDGVSPASPFQASFFLNMMGTVIFIVLLKPSKADEELKG